MGKCNLSITLEYHNTLCFVKSAVVVAQESKTKLKSPLQQKKNCVITFHKAEVIVLYCASLFHFIKYSIKVLFRREGSSLVCA